ncbi:MAG: hypothetical protein MZU97_09560 [Bacillus subtilis]|nr:hypothetical protein [Bacillus subtilis]
MKCPVCGAELAQRRRPRHPVRNVPRLQGRQGPGHRSQLLRRQPGRDPSTTSATCSARHYAFRAGTIGTCAAKTAYAMVRDYFEKQNEERAARTIPPLRIRRAEMERLAKGIDGSKRTSGQHPGGIVVVPNDTRDLRHHADPASRRLHRQDVEDDALRIPLVRKQPLQARRPRPRRSDDDPLPDGPREEGPARLSVLEA